MFGPLSFPSASENPITSTLSNHYEETSCMLCEEQFVLERQRKVFLQHLLLNHSVVISDVKKIACLERYIKYWKEKLRIIQLEELGIQQFIGSDKIKDSDLLDIGDREYVHKCLSEGGKVFVFSDSLPEDSKLRNTLQTKRLELVLDQQRQEREITDYCRECLFCHTDITGTITDYLNHLSGKHNLFLGQPQNLVFVDQLINTIENKLENLRCLYCEKIFKDRNVLKEHMRKKLHKRINPKNTEYDRFYIINYLEMGKTWKHLENVKEHENPDSDGSDSDWSDWQEEMQLQIVCLFCKNNSISWIDTLNHMKMEHGFDYKELTVDMDFYQQVKLVNYIRRQIHRLSCIKCDFTTSSSLESLLAHMKNECHFTLPDKSLWDQPEYFFPTYENDLFLCQIDDPGKSETSSVADGDTTHCE